MRSDVHPISGATYEELGEGEIKVTFRSGAYGIFDWEGRWKEGPVTHADPHMLNYVGGPTVPPEFDVPRTFMPARGMKKGESLSETSKAAAAQYAGATPITGADGLPYGKYIGDPGRDTLQGKRSSAITWNELLDLDTHPELMPSTLREESPMPGGVTKVPTERYFSQKWHDLEVEKLWKRVWQMACHVDDIPEIGDYLVYDVADLSYLVVRTGPREFKAFNNACLHRGRQLREFDGKCATEFRCPFHGWCWEIDGSLREIPSEWDFPEVRNEAGHLREAKVGTWGGFVFINPDPDCESFESFLGNLPEHFARYEYEKRYKQLHVAKIVRANWKASQEAFMEGYHVIATHPQIMMTGGDGANHQHDVFGNWSRGITITARTSAHRGIHPPREELQAQRKALADRTRESLREIIGDRVDIFCDSELVDSPYNLLFPNFHPWGNFSRLVYRFRPYGNDPNMSIHEVMYLTPWPDDVPKPPNPPIKWVGPDEHWTEAHEFGSLARILNQDSYNLPKQQKGLRAKTDPYVIFSNYGESRIRHFHALYDQWLGVENTAQ